MTSHIQMKALAENPERVRTLASYLLSLEAAEWTDWEIDFLESMARREGPEALTMRQREVLVELEESTKRYSTFDGLNVKKLVADCWIARLDLDDADADFIDGLKAQGATTLRRRTVTRLLACARQLHLVERYVAVA